MGVEMKLSDMKIGDVVYRVGEKNNGLSRTKIHKVIDGEDWFKYSSKVREYVLSEVILCGVIKKDLKGEFPSDISYEKDDVYYVKNSEDQIYELEEFSMDHDPNSSFYKSSYYFKIEDAENAISTLREKARAVDLNGTVGDI